MDIIVLHLRVNHGGHNVEHPGERSIENLAVHTFEIYLPGVSSFSKKVIKIQNKQLLLRINMRRKIQF